MIYRKLSEVAPPSASRAKPAPNETVWHLTLDQIESGSGQIVSRVYGRASEAGTSTFAFDSGNVLYSKLRPYLNKVICPDSNGIATTELVPLRPIPNELNREYLCFYLRSPEFVSWASAQVDGAKMPRMKMKSFWAYEIPVLPLDDQVRIAHLLGKVEGLIAQRKQHLQQLDDLLKSVFIKMFGDPIRNEKGWHQNDLESFIDKARGISYGIVQRGDDVPEGVPVLRIRDIISERYIESDLVRTDPSISAKYSRTVLGGGELLLSIRGTVGAVSIAPASAAGWNVSRELAVIPVGGGINVAYLVQLLRSMPMQRLFASMIKGVAQSGLNLGEIRKIGIILPPDDLQNEFESIATRIRSLIVYYRQSLADLEALYGALSQRAFEGELDLSRVPLPKTEAQELPTAMPVETPSLADQPNAINLPDTDLLLAALNDLARLKELLPFWLDAYRSQLSATTFSTQAFLAAAQARLNERLWAMSNEDPGDKELKEHLSNLYPNGRVDLCSDAYEQVKEWVFKRIESRDLKQTRNIISVGGRRQFGNKIVLRSRGGKVS